jgi:uncharacterized repeat protein (TIGR02543 family)
MTIADKLLALYDIKNDLLAAIIGKGGSLNEDSPFRNYAPAVVAIPEQLEWDVATFCESEDSFSASEAAIAIAQLDLAIFYNGNGATIGSPGSAENLSLFTTAGSASASSHLSTNVASRLIDNNPSTYWSFNAVTDVTWWQYDFGAGNEKRCHLFTKYVHSSYPSYAELRASNDGINWDVITLLFWPGFAGTISFYNVATVLKYRYFRIYLKKTNTSERMYEADFYGRPTSTSFGILYSEVGECAVIDCDFVRTGYTFDSWNTAADGSGDSYDPDDTIVLDEYGEPVILYAQWTAA